MYLKYIHKQKPNKKDKNHNNQKFALMHPYRFKGQCIQVATMFIFKVNINRNQKFSITLLKSRFVNKK